MSDAFPSFGGKKGNEGTNEVRMAKLAKGRTVERGPADARTTEQLVQDSAQKLLNIAQNNSLDGLGSPNVGSNVIYISKLLAELHKEGQVPHDKGLLSSTVGTEVGKITSGESSDEGKKEVVGRVLKRFNELVISQGLAEAGILGRI